MRRKTIQIQMLLRVECLAVAPVATGVNSSNPNGDYTVVAGDTLSKIAKQFNVQGGYEKLQELNAKYIPNKDLILVGQKIATK